MKEFLDWKGYKHNYIKHIKEITRLQMLLDIEERELFKLIETKKQLRKNKGFTEIEEPRKVNYETKADFETQYG